MHQLGRKPLRVQAPCCTDTGTNILRFEFDRLQRLAGLRALTSNFGNTIYVWTKSLPNDILEDDIEARGDSMILSEIKEALFQTLDRPRAGDIWLGAL